MKALWTALKIFLSTVLALLALLSFVIMIINDTGFELLPVSASSLLLSGALWIKFPAIPTWFGMTAIGIGMFYMSYCSLVDTTERPKQCTGRSSLFCELQNGFSELTGNPGVAFLWILCGIFFISRALKLKKRGTPEARFW